MTYLTVICIFSSSQDVAYKTLANTSLQRPVVIHRARVVIKIVTACVMQYFQFSLVLQSLILYPIIATANICFYLEYGHVFVALGSHTIVSATGGTLFINHSHQLNM